MKKEKNIRKISIFLMIIGLVIVASIFLFFGKSKVDVERDNSDFGINDSIVAIYDEENESSKVYLGEKMIGEIEGQAYIDTNMNNTSCYVHGKKIIDAYPYLENNSVYCVKDDELYEVGNDMILVANAMQSKEALVVDKDGVLYRFNGEKLEELYDGKISYAAISGDGKSFSYTSNGDSYFGTDADNLTKVEDMVIMYISQDGECMYATKDISFIKLSDISDFHDCTIDMKEIEYSCYAELCSVNSKGEVTELNEKVVGITGLNTDGTEIIFKAMDGTYISVKGGEAKKISDRNIENVYSMDMEIEWCGLYGSFDTFKGMLCDGANFDITEDKYHKERIIYNDVSFESINVISDTYDIEVLVDSCEEIKDINSHSKMVYYMDDSDYLCVLETLTGTVTKLSRDAIFLGSGKCVFSDDGEFLNYIVVTADSSEGDDEPLYEVIIYYLDDKGRMEKMYSSVGDYIGSAEYDNGYLLFTYDKTYYVEGEIMREVEGFEEITDVFSADIGENVYVCDEDNMYVIKDLKKVRIKD